MLSKVTRFHVAVSIAILSVIARGIGFEQIQRAYRGPEGMPTPILLQVANGVNQPAVFPHFLLSRVPLLFELLDNFLVFLVLVLALWVWFFWWIDFLRKRTRAARAFAWGSVAFAAVAGAACLYRTDDVAAVNTFPALLDQAGLANALEASSALSWLFALAWGLFLVGSAIVGGMQQAKTDTMHEAGVAAVPRVPHRSSRHKGKHKKRH